MNQREILDILLERLNDGAWVLAVLKQENEPISKEKLRDKVNELYQEHNNTKEKLISSRHVLDTLFARLEGAGLVDVQMLARARMYSLSALGKELIEHRKRTKN